VVNKSLPSCVKVPSFVAIGLMVAEIWRFFYFFKMAAVRHLKFVMRVFGPLRRAFVGLYHCAKCRWNQHNNFDNMRVLIFCDLNLKTPSHAPEMGVCGILPPKWDQSHRDPERHFLARRKRDIPEMEPGLPVTGHQVSDFGRVESGHGSEILSRFNFWAAPT